jgi:hypothetical protein
MYLPLMSDILAEKISHLFSNARPHILEMGEGDNNDDITWVDVIREGSFYAEQQNEKYCFRLRNREALFEMTQFDYDLILSGIPWKLVHPQSHANDILAEISAIDLIMSEMRLWKSIAAKRKLSPESVFSFEPANSIEQSLRPLTIHSPN